MSTSHQKSAADRSVGVLRRAARFAGRLGVWRRARAVPGRGLGVFSGARRLAAGLFAGVVAVSVMFVVFVASTFATAGRPIIASGFGCSGTSHTSVKCFLDVQPEELETHWRFEYSSSASGPWTVDASGVITQAEAKLHRNAGEASVSFVSVIGGLIAEKTYFFRAVATNEDGEAESDAHGETVPLRPQPSMEHVTNPRTASVHVRGVVKPNGTETHWRFEYAQAEADGQAPVEGSPAWTVAAGASGTIPKAEAEALYAEADARESAGNSEAIAQIVGLSAGTGYYVRLHAENEPEPGVHKQAVSGTGSESFFETEGPPKVTTFELHALHGEGIVRALGAVQPGDIVSSGEQTVTVGGGASGGTFKLCFEGRCTGVTGTGTLAGGSATGTGNLTYAKGYARFTEGSSVASDVETASGAFAVGEEFAIGIFVGESACIPAHATITVVEPGKLTLSSPWRCRNTQGESKLLEATSNTVSNVVTSSGSFAIGQGISGAGIPANTHITGVGPGTLTLSAAPTEAGSGVSLATNTRIVGDLSSFGFQVGEQVSGAGIPAGTIIEAVNSEAKTLTLSKDATVAGSGVTLYADIPFGASAETVQGALRGPTGGEVSVYGNPGGPYTVYFDGRHVARKSVPQLTSDSSGLTPSGTVGIATTQAGGEGYDTKYYFEYVGQKDFENEGGFASAATKSTPTVDIGVGEYDEGGRVQSTSTGVDLTGVQPGETYHYRLVAQSTFPGIPLVYGQERTLKVPAPVAVEPETSCPNQAFRTGPSAALPDCRAYELVTPAEKEGANEAFQNGSHINNAGVTVGGDGNHLVYNSLFTQWGTEGLSPYFFSRGEHGWQMTAGTPLLEAGIDTYTPELYDRNLTRFAFSSGWVTGAGEGGASKEVEFKVGPAGGPYTLVATVPRKDVERQGETSANEDGGWVAASEDFSTLVLKLEDHTLVGHSTHTTSGSDLYVYSEASGLAQLNVDSSGKTIGSCGASMAQGQGGITSSPFAVSADGSRAFFSAAPGSVCSAPAHLYMREPSAGTTVDIGEYEFVEANAAGSDLLIRHDGNLYHYHVEDGSSEPVAPGTTLSSSARYTFQQSSAPAWEFGLEVGHSGAQILRVDNVEHAIECVSCASSFDPEPRFTAMLAGGSDESGGISTTRNDTPELMKASANGDFVFFDTISALVPQDVDGEEEKGEFDKSEGSEGFEETWTPSSDVYEWRRPGLDGCALAQGCVSLISNGLGGRRVMLLGSADEGRDVFFTTAARLVSQDHDGALDVYDARIGGGFPPVPPRPVECEGDACSTPASAPNDVTPASFTFAGVGNVTLTEPTKTTIVKTKKKIKSKKKTKKGKKGAHKKAIGRARTRRKVGAGRRVRAARTGRRGGR